MRIKSKLIISYVLLIVFSVSVLNFLIIDKSRKAFFQEATEKNERIVELIHNMVSVRNDLLSEKVWSDLRYVEELLNNLGKIRIDDTKQIQVENFTLPALYAGDTNLTLDNTFVDHIKESIGTIASVFLLKENKLIRVTTNLTKDGKRIIGTYMASRSDVYKKIIKNETYYGTQRIGKDWIVTGYKPLLDSDNNVIGAIALGYKGINSYFEKTLSNIKIGETGYVYIMNSNGDVLVHPNREGENLSAFEFTKEILKKKKGIIQYEFDGISKLANYIYFEPWDLYIVATANHDDLNASSKPILYTSWLIGAIVSLIGAILSLFVANTLVKPINKLKNYMETVSAGDLTVYSDIRSKDEIGILSDSFNHMLDENKKSLEEVINQDQIKTEFFSNISHELKTPINMILSIAQLFSLYAKNDSQMAECRKFSKHMNIIKQNCYRLLRLVNNLIDITKIDSGFMQLKLKNQNIIEVVENVTLSTVEYVQSKERNIIFDTDIEERFMAIDAEKIERIMLNLISNAVKFTEPGDKIEVNTHDKNEEILICVKDTGIGIPENQQEKIFERFKQVDPHLSRSHEGSGIGLSLVKSLVEMHGGKIFVKSKYGEGTEIMIILPVKFIDTNNDPRTKDDYEEKTNVEKIQIEFSDIYA
ncbi:Cache 3/Cache 2 fusion domain-containing protein [Marinisporobacter balticus]|uniref:histidine kinase n=1 Tax=Marinisporobacter balticus TaxID=2018667 RepID=A0A4R2KGE6_9FIRM|nr:Cache 3/Cache 2 fusion domain-containing protein [Marinisporobacter balticus]TCO72673.1 signal transduction histidine kinase [Marinisporobacter balticus]